MKTTGQSVRRRAPSKGPQTQTHRPIPGGALQSQHARNQKVTDHFRRLPSSPRAPSDTRSFHVPFKGSLERSTL